MRNKIIAILLLITTTFVLAHGMIPHHHHEGSNMEFFAHQASDIEPCSEDSNHDHHDCHAHTVCSDFDFTNSLTIAKTSISDYHFLNYITVLYTTLCIEENTETESPSREFLNLITQKFKLETTVLRGPPTC